jgi:molecular chaperone GrpE
MVNEKDDDDVTFDVDTGEDTHTDEPELEEIEDRGDNKIKQLREKLKTTEDEKKKLQDNLQRERAEFLNARKRIEDERARDRIRSKRDHVLELLPLCDSFQMAMSNKEAWEKADGAWRKGIEGINAQLNTILKNSGVSVVNPRGEAFDPQRHEAVSTAAVTDKKLDGMVVSVMQSGYEISHNGQSEIIRPARVTIGQYSE